MNSNPITTVEADRTIRRWKRWIKRIFLSSLALLAILFILFCIFIASPFEMSYSQPLLTLVKDDWDFSLCLPHPKQSMQNLKTFPNLKKILTHPNWTQLLRTEIATSLQEMKEDWEERKKRFTENSGMEIETVLDHIFGKEMILAGKAVKPITFPLDGKNFAKNNYFFFATRISFAGKVVYGVLNCLPNSLQKKIQFYPTEEGYLEARNQKESMYFSLVRDVLLVSYNKQTLNTIQKILDGEFPKNLTHSYPSLTAKISDTKNDLVAFVSKRLFEEKKTTVPIEDIVATLQFQPQKISIQLDSKPNPSLLQEIQPYLTLTQQPKIFPKSIAGYACFHLSWDKTWQYIQNNLSGKARQNFDQWMNDLDEYYRSSDFVGNWIKTNLSDQVCIMVSTTNFKKEKVEPFDQYPNISLMIPCQQKNKILPELSQILTEITPKIIGPDAEKKGITLFSQEKYAGRNYLRFKWPDTTGGAIRPMIGLMGENMILTSHEGFFKDWQDVGDSIEPGKTNPYSQTFGQNIPISLYLNGSNIGVILEQNKVSLSRPLAQKYKGRGFEEQRKKIEERIREVALILSVIDPIILGTVQQSEQTIRIQLNIEN